MEYAKITQRNLPLEVTHASWENDILLFGGADWSFSSAGGAWRIVNEGAIACGCDDECSALQVRELIGHQLVDIQSATTNYAFVDPIMTFSNNVVLEIFSSTVHESWVLRLPNEEVVYVCVPSSK